jgi:hypothetical protein
MTAARRRHLARALAGPLAALVAAAATAAQEAINSDAAMQPSPGATILREQFRHQRGESEADGFTEVTEIQLRTALYHGLSRTVAVQLAWPVAWIEAESTLTGARDADVNAGDLWLQGKWRFWQHDTSPTDTSRAAVMFGVQLDTGDGFSLDPDFSSDSIDPTLGAVFTTVHGRSGVNASATMIWNGDDRDEDAIRYDAYLYRLAPTAYRAGGREA